jgi:hypothetical protein
MGQVWKLEINLLRDLSAFGGGGVVDGAELLVALRDHVDFAVGVAGLQTPGELGLLPLGQMLHAVAEQAADLVERVVFVPSVAEGSCWTRRRTSSTTCVPRRTTWKASATSASARGQPGR